MIISLTALPQNWPSIRNNWSWPSKPWTLSTGCMRRLKRMMIEKLNSFARFETDPLNDWGTGVGSLSCEPSQKELTWTPNRYNCIGATSLEVCQLCLPGPPIVTPTSSTIHQASSKETAEAFRRRSKSLVDHCQLSATNDQGWGNTVFWGGESSQVAEVRKKHRPSSGKGWKWPQSHVSELSMKRSRMGSNPVKGSLGEKGAWWKNFSPRKRSGSPKDVERWKKELTQARTNTSKHQPLWHWPGIVALQEICQYQKTMSLLI